MTELHAAPAGMVQGGDGLALELLAAVRAGVDARIDRRADRLATRIGGREGEAVAYALRSPGKRVRAALVTAAYRAAGGTAADVAEVAAAVEIVHAYSLVHDDLPCMDDDDLRRGRPTTHVAYDVPTATRAGWLLVPVAAEALAEAAALLELGPDLLGAMARELFAAGGIEGMVGGQWLDLEAEHRRLDLPQLIAVHRGKTGALITASCVIGGLAARADDDRLAALRGFGEDVGLAFQIADDVLDVTGTSEELGKTAGKDAAVEKSTYVGLLGVDGAREEAARLARRAVERLAGARIPTRALGALAGYIVSRNS
jgi:geranylgeranyl pyrophosphate synthase